MKTKVMVLLIGIVFLGLFSFVKSYKISEGRVYSYVGCQDGWPSPNIGRQGACSHHGGEVTNTIDNRTKSQKKSCLGLNVFGIICLVLSLFLVGNLGFSGKTNSRVYALRQTDAENTLPKKTPGLALTATWRWIIGLDRKMVCQYTAAFAALAVTAFGLVNNMEATFVIVDAICFIAIVAYMLKDGDLLKSWHLNNIVENVFFIIFGGWMALAWAGGIALCWLILAAFLLIPYALFHNSPHMTSIVTAAAQPAYHDAAATVVASAKNDAKVYVPTNAEMQKALAGVNVPASNPPAVVESTESDSTVTSALAAMRPAPTIPYAPANSLMMGGDPSRYVDNIQGAIQAYKQAGSPPEAKRQLQQVIQANYNKIAPTGYFAKGEGQRLAHILRGAWGIQAMAATSTENDAVSGEGAVSNQSIPNSSAHPTASFTVPSGRDSSVTPYLPNLNSTHINAPAFTHVDNQSEPHTLDEINRVNSANDLRSLGVMVDWRATSESVMLDEINRINSANDLHSLGVIVDWRTANEGVMLDEINRINSARELHSLGVTVDWRTNSESDMLDEINKINAGKELHSIGGGSK